MNIKKDIVTTETPLKFISRLTSCDLPIFTSSNISFSNPYTQDTKLSVGIKYKNLPEISVPTKGFVVVPFHCLDGNYYIADDYLAFIRALPRPHPSYSQRQAVRSIVGDIPWVKRSCISYEIYPVGSGYLIPVHLVPMFMSNQLLVNSLANSFLPIIDRHCVMLLLRDILYIMGSNDRSCTVTSFIDALEDAKPLF